MKKFGNIVPLKRDLIINKMENYEFRSGVFDSAKKKNHSKP